jgi:signal transduction histidine kinase
MPLFAPIRGDKSTTLRLASPTTQATAPVSEVLLRSPMASHKVMPIVLRGITMDVVTPRFTRRLVVGTSFAAVGASAAAFIVAQGSARNLLSTQFLPHTFCYLNDRKLIALHFGSDAVIWLSYVSIALTLAYLVRRTRREIPYSWMFLAFGTFIIACGFTHFMEMVVLWKPLYWLAGDIKLVTALASVVTAIALPPLVPQVQAMIRSAHVSEARGLQLERANEELRHLSAHALSAQDEERRRIARDLHDGVGQYLAAMKMSFDVALAQSAGSDGSTGPLRDCLDLVERCTREIRTVSHLLHPPLLEEMGLSSAIPWYVAGFQERSGITVDLDMPPDFDRLDPAVEVVLFRVLQEGLTNIHRHSGSKRADIRLQIESGQAILTIQDQGKGFDTTTGTFTAGVGIAGMRERVRELGGEFKINSRSSGTVVEATVPLQGRAVECRSES